MTDDDTPRDFATRADLVAYLLKQYEQLTLTRGNDSTWRSTGSRYEATLAEGRLRVDGLGIDWPVGEAPEAVLADGDVLYVRRNWEEFAGLMIVREGRLVMALGAVGPSPDPEVVFHDDTPNRLAEWSIVARMLEESRATLIWLDASAPDVSQQLERLGELTSPAVIAIAADEQFDAVRLSARAWEATPSQYRVFETVWVTPEFKDPESWRAYIHSLPRTYPRDDRLVLRVDGRLFELEDGEQRTSGGWHFWVAHIGRHPREATRFGLARVQPNLTMQMVVRSVWALKQASPA